MHSLFKKIFIVAGAVIVAVILFFVVLWLPVFNKVQPIEFGASFSKSYTESLDLDWQATYLAILDDLGVRRLRLSSEWDEIETSDSVYDFYALDWQIAEAEKRGTKILLAVGERQPRWPECHAPAWLSSAPREEVEERLLNFVKTVVERYKDSPALEMWQVENEPFLDIFGKCPRGNANFLRREIDLVKSLDDRPVLITDSGELSTWRRTAPLGDYFGTSIYRLVYSPLVGYYQHFFPPAFYRLKALLVGLPRDKVIISELQAEPWVSGGSITDMPISEQKNLMSPERVENHLNFARETGFSPAYLWGVEWWYWLKIQGDDSIWRSGKNLWQK